MIIPDNETAVDFLNCEAIAKTVVAVLAANRNRAVTLGVHGDWGAGKSSVLKMIEQNLSDDATVAVLWFNGWTFQGFDDAKTVLIEAIITELMRQRKGVAKVQALGRELLQRVDWLKALKQGAGFAWNVTTGLPSPDQLSSALDGIKGAVTGLGKASAEDIEEQLTAVASILKPTEGANMPEVITDFRARFAELLDEAKIDQLVVLIDDLDRCLPETAIETLEAIRLFLFVPRAAFIIGADEGMIEYAVRRHFPDLPVSPTSVPYARNYLEKLIQVPFRIPALGLQETRIYVLLLLVSSIVGDDSHAGFGKLLSKARNVLNSPWLAGAISQAEVRAVDNSKRNELDAAFALATRIGPILAEGTQGNPRQIKRFLNALLVRQAIAQARGLEEQINQASLAKLMLVERFQTDFYEHLARSAMATKDGKVQELADLEAATKRAPETKGKKGKLERPQQDDESKWLERDQLRQWLEIEPAMGGEDLRPYVFVARERRVGGSANAASSTEALIDQLAMGGQMAVRGAEQAVKELVTGDANVVFSALREKVLQASDYSLMPEAMHGLRVLVKHHPQLQSELVSMLATLDSRSLGFWATTGWTESVTDTAAKKQLNDLLRTWESQTDNGPLKTAAAQALAAGRGK